MSPVIVTSVICVAANSSKDTAVGIIFRRRVAGRSARTENESNGTAARPKFVAPPGE